MNVVLDEAVEINVKASTRKSIGTVLTGVFHQFFVFAHFLTRGRAGRILLKGDCITLIQRADPSSGESL